ncbi:MAG: pentapeptide repeat-containing protein [Nitrospinota bacterium]|nr:pentapeptide repeat-containing protein [Nitrospinota bacterium]
MIGRRKLEHEEGEKDHTLDLRETDLRGAYLRDARLEGANLWSARLEGANLMGARLERADLRYTRLERTTLVEARLEEAHLRGAGLEGAHLEGADLRYAINLTRDQVESAHCYTKKQLPEDLRNLADLEDRPHDVDESHQTEAEA